MSEWGRVEMPEYARLIFENFNKAYAQVQKHINICLKVRMAKDTSMLEMAQVEAIIMGAFQFHLTKTLDRLPHEGCLLSCDFRLFFTFPYTLLSMQL